jgi:transposase
VVKWHQYWRKTGSAASKPRGGSVSPLEKCAARVLAVIARHPDLTLMETVSELGRRDIHTSKSSLSRFCGRHSIILKKACKLPNGSEQMWHERADVGYESKACLIPPGWYLSTRRRSAPI